MEDEKSPLTVGELQTAVGRWIRIVQENHGRLPTEADALHSSLLRRLFRGDQPLTKPPPLRYSYPDYGLATWVKTEVSEVSDVDPATYGRSVCVDQHIGWDWHDREAGVLRYRDGTLYRLTREPSWRQRWRADSREFTPEPYVATYLQRIDCPGPEAKP